MSKINVTTIGGGTGHSVMLQSLKNMDCNIHAIVGMADSGGSSGVLREELNMLPPGDVRHCLLALAKDRNPFQEIFNFRFGEGQLRGHNLGNIFFAALYKLNNNFSLAVEELSRILDIEGKVIPVTLDQTHLFAKLENGLVLAKEDTIDAFRKNGNQRIDNAWLDPLPKLNPMIGDVILNSDFIILGPGDLYTSLIQVLLVDGLSDLISKSKAQKIFFGNIMTKYGQTNLLRLVDQIKEIELYSSSNMDFSVINNNFNLPDSVLNHYAKDKCGLQRYVPDEFNELNGKMIFSDLINTTIHELDESDPLKNRSMVRHDPQKISEILELLFERKG